MSEPMRIERPAADEFAPYYQRYIDKVAGSDVLPALAGQIETTASLLSGLSEPRALHRYAPGKWSVKEVVVHMADSERVFAYRALRFGRNDVTPLPGFEENDWAPESRADARPMAAILAELTAVRAASLALFRSLDATALIRRGVANGQPMSARAAAWVIAGHEIHHIGVLREKYGLGS
jgi:uncharacterized damage-inducible protein DinB